MPTTLGFVGPSYQRILVDNETGQTLQVLTRETNFTVEDDVAAVLLAQGFPVMMRSEVFP